MELYLCLCSNFSLEKFQKYFWVGFCDHVTFIVQPLKGMSSVWNLLQQ